MEKVIFLIVLSILIIGYIVLRLWCTKLALAGIFFVADPPQNHFTFPVRGGQFKTPIDGDHLPAGFIDEVSRHFSGGTIYGFAPNSILEVDWPIYFTKFAKGSGKDDEHGHDDHGHTKKDDHVNHNHGNDSEGADHKMVKTTQIPKKFDASLLCDGIDTKDAIGLLYLLNMRIEIINPIQFMSLKPIGSGGIEKILNMAESGVESFNRQKDYAELVTLYGTPHGKEDLINYIKDNPEIEQLTGAKITNINMPVWNLDDGSEASKAIKQKAVNIAKNAARVAEAQGDVDVAEKQLEKAGIDYQRIQKENEGKEDLRTKLGDELYEIYIKYSEGVAKLQGTYVEKGNATNISVPASGNKGQSQSNTNNQPTGNKSQQAGSGKNNSQNQPAGSNTTTGTNQTTTT